MKTIKELEKWLIENCYSMEYYGLNGQTMIEGFILEKEGNRFILYHTERGRKEVIEYYESEEQATEKLLERIKKDEHANRNFIGIYKSEEKEKLLLSLKKRKIKFWTQDIIYGFDDIRTQIFIIGCDIRHSPKKCVSSKNRVQVYT